MIAYTIAAAGLLFLCIIITFHWKVIRLERERDDWKDSSDFWEKAVEHHAARARKYSQRLSKFGLWKSPEDEDFFMTPYKGKIP